MSLAFADSVLFAGTQYGGAYFSTDYGEKWILIDGLPSTIYIFSFAVFGNTVIAATDSGIYISKDCGLNWNRGAKQLFTDMGFLDTISYCEWRL